MYRDVKDMLGVGFQEIVVFLWSRHEGSNVLGHIKVTPTSAKWTKGLWGGSCAPSMGDSYTCQWY